MQVSRPLDDDFRRLRQSRVAIAPAGLSYQYTATKPLAKMMVPVEEIRLDVVPHCNMCGILIPTKTVDKFLCQGCRRSEFQRQRSLEDIRPASPMAGKTKALNPVKSDGCVYSWSSTESEELQPLNAEPPLQSSFRVDDAGSFRSMEVLTCFRSEAHRGLRLLLKAATAEQWHMWWAMLLSMLLLPMILTLMVVTSVGFLVLSTVVAVSAVVVYPLAYINPRLYKFAMDS